MFQDSIDGQAVIPFEGYFLRPLRASDAGLISMYAGDERIARMTPNIPYPLPDGAVDAWIENANAEDRTKHIWAIDGTPHGQEEILGTIALDEVTEDQAAVEYWIAPVLWNSGIASATLEALIANNPLNSHSLVASVFQDNPASAKVITNAGFSLIGESEVFSVARNGLIGTWDYIKRLGDG
jgi:RimJ/RimL family protein N-acetyltransferase